MAKIKLTRKSYKRNIIVFGVMLFMGIALVSTGFATWVLSQGTEIKVGSPNVNVGVVTDNALKISGLKFHYNLLKEVGKGENDQPKYELYEQVDKDTLGNNFSFNFEPVGGDVTGKVKWDVDGYSSQSINYEVLTLTITGVINPVQYIKTFEITMNLPEGIVELAEDKFINLPEFVEYDEAEDGEITFKKYVITGDSNVGFKNGYEIGDAFKIDENGNFTLKIEFEWGDIFGGDNPSEYFDSEKFIAVPSEWKPTITEDREYLYIKYCLQELRRQVHGYSYMSLDDVEYEVYQDGENWYVQKEGGNYLVEVGTNSEGENVLKNVTDTPYEGEGPKQPQISIEINITAN